MNEVWHGSNLDLAPELPDEIHCIITDPPYGIAYDSNSVRRGHSADHYNEVIENDEDPEVAIKSFMECMDLIIPKLAQDADVYVFTTWQVFTGWADAIEELDLRLKQVLVWEKGYPGMGDLEYNWGCGHELILYAKKGNRPVSYRRRGVITVPRLATKKNIHPSEKPVELLEMFVEMSTAPGDLIVDPYAGSGSTVWAAQRKGRRGIGIESNATYVDRANERLGQHGLAFEY